MNGSGYYPEVLPTQTKTYERCTLQPVPSGTTAGEIGALMCDKTWDCGTGTGTGSCSHDLTQCTCSFGWYKTTDPIVKFSTAGECSMEPTFTNIHVQDTLRTPIPHCTSGQSVLVNFNYHGAGSITFNAMIRSPDHNYYGQQTMAIQDEGVISANYSIQIYLTPSLKFVGGHVRIEIEDRPQTGATSEQLFSIFERYQWQQVSTVCPTTNCAAFSKDQIGCVGVAGAITVPLLNYDCRSSVRPDPVLLDCPVQSECSGWEVCNTTPNVCQDVGITNLVIFDGDSDYDYDLTQAINLNNEPELTLTWESSNHGAVGLEVIYKLSEDDTNPTIISTTPIQSTTNTATITLPSTLSPSPTAILALRLASPSTTDTTPIDATPSVRTLKCQWVEEWSQCSGYCLDGTTTSSFTCIDSNNKIVEGTPSPCGDVPTSETKSCPPEVDCPIDQKCNQTDEACTGGYSGMNCAVPPPPDTADPSGEDPVKNGSTPTRSILSTTMIIALVMTC